jgi:hypothetical protein
MPDLLYFTYISDAKVDMILAQIPAVTQENIATKIGFNCGLLSGEVGSEARTLETRVARLRVVEDYVRKYC